MTPPTSPWAAGRLQGRGPAALLFGRMFEDPAIEKRAFRGRRRVLAIASAGDVAMALARAGHAVTALDVNPAQIRYVAQRLRGAPTRRGQADRLLEAGRALLRPAGWTRRRLARLSTMDRCEEQVAEWRRLTSGVPGVALRALLAPAALRRGYERAFVEAAPRLGEELPGRVERGLGVHRNCDNPWAALLFTGRWPAPRPPRPVGGDLTLAVGDVAAHLAAAPTGAYDAFALSNVLDGAPPGDRMRLVAGLRRAASPGAVVVLRTLAPAPSPDAALVAQRDRALIWGGITVATVEGWV